MKFVKGKKSRNRLKPNRKFRKAFGNVILLLRKKEKMSKAQFAFEAGIGREHIGIIERGKQSPTLDVLEAIARTFNKKPKDLLDFDY